MNKATLTNSNLKSTSNTGLKNKILFTLFVLALYRFGTYVPIPGIYSDVLKEITEQNSEGILGVFNMFSGGALGRMSIFALAIMPYITASIILQLGTVVSKKLGELKKDGEAGRKKITQLTRYLTIFITIFQGYAAAVGIEGIAADGVQAVISPGMLFRTSTVVCLVGGTMLLMWMGEQITSRGVGNGISLIIFTGIVAGLPDALAGTLIMSRNGELSSLFVLFILLIAIGLTFFIVFMERSVRKVLVQYPKRQKGNKIFGGDKTHIPLKINTAGVIPPIFASALILFPVTIVDYRSSLLSAQLNEDSSQSGFLDLISVYLAHGTPLYMFLYLTAIVFFAFLYTSIQFNPKETADNIRKNGGFVAGIRPGKDTENYFNYTLTRLTVIGAAYLSFVCIVPEILISNYNVPFYLGGTSLLIVVNVIIDTITQIQSHLYAGKYQNLISKSKLKRR